MAKNKEVTAEQAVEQQQAAQLAASGSVTLRTPENTPLPGGGRWRWDDASSNWVSNEPVEETTDPTA